VINPVICALIAAKERNAAVAAVFQNYKGATIWHLFWPVANCQNKIRVGLLGDGGKWICNPQKVIIPKACTVYSFGSASEISFEKFFAYPYYGCKTFSFDPTPGQELTVPKMLLPGMSWKP